MIFYFYKIVNNINGKFYYGVHRTENINDGYMGSGHRLLLAYKKYGKNNFTKYILKYFNTEKEMYEYEKLIVNNDMVKNAMCYNVINGGYPDIYEVGKLINRNVCEETRKKISKAGRVRWSKMDADDRKEFGLRVKTSKKYIDHIKKVREKKENVGYNNFDFLKRWKGVYDDKSFEISSLIKHSNLPDAIIIKKIYKKKVKTERLLKYYEHVGLLGKKIREERRSFYVPKNMNRGHFLTTGIKKTYYTNDIVYNFMFYIKEMFEKLHAVIDISRDDSISDSMVIQGDKHMEEYLRVIKYYEELGVFKNVRIVNIRVKKNVTGIGELTVPAKKTKFDISDKYTTNKTIIDEEMNEYGIDENGRPFCKGRFELQEYGNRQNL